MAKKASQIEDIWVKPKSWEKKDIVAKIWGKRITRTRNRKGPDNAIILNCLKAEKKASMMEVQGIEETVEGEKLECRYEQDCVGHWRPWKSLECMLRWDVSGILSWRVTYY